MRTIRTGGASALLLAPHACACAQSTEPPMQQVVVKSGVHEARAQSTTTAIVVGGNELLRQGDTSLAEVLKRQPGITLDASPGKAPPMRGMGGAYVAILLNGLPAPSGFSLESISPDLIERIEIGRAASAETSSQAVAGTINVILRRAGPAKGGAANDIKAGSAFLAGRAAPQLVAQHSGRAGALACSVSATRKRSDNPIKAVTTEQGAQPALLRRTAWLDHQVEDLLDLAPRLSWQPNADDSITSQSYLRKRHVDNAKREIEATDTGRPTAFPHALHSYETRPVHAYADLAWTRKLGAGARLAAKLSGFYVRREAAFEYRGMDPQDQLLEFHLAASGPVEREWTFNGSWSKVDSVPGSDNRIDGQAARSGNLGLDYAAPSGRADLDGTFTWRAPLASRSSAVLFSGADAKRQLGLYAVWKCDARSRLRLSVSDLLHPDSRERLVYQGASPLARTTVYRGHPVWRLVWEQTL